MLVVQKQVGSPRTSEKLASFGTDKCFTLDLELGFSVSPSLSVSLKTNPDLHHSYHFVRYPESLISSRTRLSSKCSLLRLHSTYSFLKPYTILGTYLDSLRSRSHGERLSTKLLGLPAHSFCRPGCSWSIQQKLFYLIPLPFFNGRRFVSLVALDLNKLLYSN